MTPDPETPRASRNRRRGDMFSLLTRLAGAVTIVIFIAMVINIGIHKLERSPPVQPEYDLKKKTPEPEPAQAGTVAATTPEGPVQGIANMEAKRPALEAALRSFFQAKTVDEKAAAARDTDRVRPLMMGYYLQRPLRSRSISGLGTCQSVAEKGYRLGYIQVLFAKEDPVSIIVEEMADGQFRADWESLVRYGEMEWDDFLTQKPSTPTLLRVLASRDESSEASGPQWLEISSPGSDRRIKAYFDRKDPQFQPLIEQLELGGWKNVPLTLRLCYSEPKLNANAAQIVGSEGKGWLIITDRRS